MARSRLDFPHPECPTTSSDCPFDTSMLRSCTAPASSHLAPLTCSGVFLGICMYLALRCQLHQEGS